MHRQPRSRSILKKWFFYGVISLVVVLGLIQLVPVDRSNPPVETEIPAPPEVKTVLRSACYDCHSNETIWPWYRATSPRSRGSLHTMSMQAARISTFPPGIATAPSSKLKS